MNLDLAGKLRLVQFCVVRFWCERAVLTILSPLDGIGPVIAGTGEASLIESLIESTGLQVEWRCSAMSFIICKVIFCIRQIDRLLDLSLDSHVGWIQWQQFWLILSLELYSCIQPWIRWLFRNVYFSVSILILTRTLFIIFLNHEIHPGVLLWVWLVWFVRRGAPLHVKDFGLLCVLVVRITNRGNVFVMLCNSLIVLRLHFINHFIS